MRRAKRAGERVMATMRRLYARLRLRINESKSAVASVRERQFLGFSFLVRRDGEVKRRLAPKALERMKDRVRELTRRSIGRSLAQVCEALREYLLGWKGYFQLAETPSVFAALDGWIRHRLRALQLKHWRHGTTTYRELRARGESAWVAQSVASHGARWWRRSAKMIGYALPNTFFDSLGLPRLAA